MRPGQMTNVATMGAVAAAFVGFDFTGGSLPSGATLTRSSVGTRTNVAGALASELSNVARFDYQPTTHASFGLLYEAAVTNVSYASQDLTSVEWSLGAATSAATVLTEDSTTARHRVQSGVNNYPLTSGTPVTASAIASERAGAKRYLCINVPATGFALAFSGTFDLAAGTITQSLNCTAAIAAAPTGWLCSVTATPNASGANGAVFFYLANASANGLVLPASYLGDGASGLNLSEMQFENGSVPSSRVRTPSGISTTATRAADVLTLDWSSKGVADGAITVRYTFDDSTTQDVAATVASGTAVVPTTLTRSRIKTAQKV